MKFLLQQEKRFYFFAFYIFFMIFWILEDILSLFLNAHWLHYSQTYFTFMETLIAIFSIIGIYFLFKEVKEKKQDIHSAKEVIENLKSKNQKFASCFVYQGQKRLTSGRCCGNCRFEKSRK